MINLFHCTLCPHACGVNRLAGETGLCREGLGLRISHAGLHFGEEPAITGKGGSGTVFITGCAMACPFCQKPSDKPGRPGPNGNNWGIRPDMSGPAGSRGGKHQFGYAHPCGGGFGGWDKVGPEHG